MVEGCDLHADGWIDVETWKALGRTMPDGAGEKLWACKEHLVDLMQIGDG